MVIIANWGAPPLAKRALLVSASASLVVLMLKFAGYISTGSAAILSDALESIINAAAGVFAYISLKIYSKPPDASHPYGHGKIEFISAAFEGGAIVIASLCIIYKSVDEIAKGASFHKIDIGIILVALASAINLVLAILLIKIGRRNNLLILEADGRHLLTDVVTSVSVLLGLGLMRITDYYILDPLIAILFALFIMRTGIKLIKISLGGIMDKSNPEDETKIQNILDGYIGKICAYHKIRHRHGGNICFVDFHIVVPAEMKISKAHQIATEIEEKIARALGSAGVTAHIEPCTNQECNVCKMWVMQDSNLRPAD